MLIPLTRLKNCFLAALTLMGLTVYSPPRASLAQTPAYAWPDVPPVASYNIQVSLNTQDKELVGHEIITYHNTTDVPIPDAVLHLYLNAFASNVSFFLLDSSSSRGFNWDPRYPGWIEITNICLEDGSSLPLELLEDRTLARVEFPSPVPAGGDFSLEIDFVARLPKVFARTGFYDDFFMIGQWFPKLGVWQPDGWNAYPFYANSEFFADFGTYDVSITLPSDYVTGATGLLLAKKDNGNGTHTLTYHAEAVIDFAWTASPHFEQASRQVNGVEVIYLYLPEHAFTVERALDAAEAALTHYGKWYGDYPYPRLIVVDVPQKAGGAGGMEYPMLITAGMDDITGLGIATGQFDHIFEAVIVHEIGHEWWYATVAFNEAEEPWLDEGFTDYSTARLMNILYGPYNAINGGNAKMSYLQLRRTDYLTLPDVPMYGKAWEFDGARSYGVGAYAKPLLALSTLENMLGEQTMLKVMRTFYQRYRFTHATTEDFRRTAEEVSQQDLAWFFNGLVYDDSVVNYSVMAVDQHTVTVTRQGELTIPTGVEVTFADGGVVREPWGGKESGKVFTYPDREVIAAEVDPDGHVLLDLQWSDNGLSRRVDIWSWLAVNVRLLYQLQNWLLYWGGL